MKNTLYLDASFNFLLLECEETSADETEINISLKTSSASNQRFEISVAGSAPTIENLPSNELVIFNLKREYWADNNTVVITPKNASITGASITLYFPALFNTSGALNYISDTEFEVQGQNEDFAGGGSGSGSSSSAGAAFDFVEAIRNIGFRLLDEPTNVNIYYDSFNNAAKIKWTDPSDIQTNEPAPAAWAGTIVVRKENNAPRHKWDGSIIVDSTTRNAYQTTPLVDDTVEANHIYYYGIFPYDTKGDYRFTKIVSTAPKFDTESFDNFIKTNDLSHLKQVTKYRNYGGNIPAELQQYIGTDWILNVSVTGYYTYLTQDLNGDYVWQTNSAEECFEFFPVKPEFVGKNLIKLRIKVMLTDVEGVSEHVKTAGRFGLVDSATNNVSNIFFFDYNEDPGRHNIDSTNIWYSFEVDLTGRVMNDYIRLYVVKGKWKFKDIEFVLAD